MPPPGLQIYVRPRMTLSSLVMTLKVNRFAINVQQHQTATDPWIKSTDLGYELPVSCYRLQGVSKRVGLPPKTFWNIFTSVKSFCVNICEFAGNPFFVHLS